jgi:hypothetical protein
MRWGCRAPCTRGSHVLENKKAANGGTCGRFRNSGHKAACVFRLISTPRACLGRAAQQKRCPAKKRKITLDEKRKCARHRPTAAARHVCRTSKRIFEGCFFYKRVRARQAAPQDCRRAALWGRGSEQGPSARLCLWNLNEVLVRFFTLHMGLEQYSITVVDRTTFGALFQAL